MVFYARNPTGTEGTAKETGCEVKGRYNKQTKSYRQQTVIRGAIYCDSMTNLSQAFANLPTFGERCNPDVRGTFLDTSLNGLS